MKIKASQATGHGAGVLFCDKDTGEFLWVKRSNEGDFGGYWCCGGGGVEDNETIDQGVKRECREELGYDEPFTLLHMDRNSPPDNPNFVYHNHLAFVPKFTPVLNDEHTEYLWSKEMPTPVHPGLEKAIANYIERNKGR